MRALLLVFLLFCWPHPAFAYFRLNAQVQPYLVIPKTRPAQRASSSSASAQPGPGVQKFRLEMLTLINTERGRRKLAPLKMNALLERSAQAHAEDMLKRKYFSHESPNGGKPEDRIRATRYFDPPCPDATRGCTKRSDYGENIAQGQKTPSDVMKEWMSSKIHRDNILKSAFRDFGLGYAGGFWVQHFGRISMEQK